jgi:hypothetical protein
MMFFNFFRKKRLSGLPDNDSNASLRPWQHDNTDRDAGRYLRDGQNQFLINLKCRPGGRGSIGHIQKCPGTVHGPLLYAPSPLIPDPDRFWHHSVRSWHFSGHLLHATEGAASGSNEDHDEDYSAFMHFRSGVMTIPGVFM